jgi:hypothetical protein
MAVPQLVGKFMKTIRATRSSLRSIADRLMRSGTTLSD